MTSLVEVPSAVSILRQLKKNLKSLSELKEVKRQSAHWTGEIRNERYESFIASLNRYVTGIGSEPFSEDDFKGAHPYPDFAFSSWYASAHTLPALSFGVAVAREKWPAVVRKLRIASTSRGISLDEFLFAGQDNGLNKTGLTLHIDDGDMQGIEFEQLYKDISLYSRVLGQMTQMDISTLQDPQKVASAIIYNTFKDFCAVRIIKMNNRELNQYLCSRSFLYLQSIIDFLRTKNTPDEVCNSLYNMYAERLHTPLQRIPSAIDGLYETIEQLGPHLVTPLLFSFGSVTDGNRRYVHSPFEDVCFLLEYIHAGEITPNKITTILQRKGYQIPQTGEMLN